MPLTLTTRPPGLRALAVTAVVVTGLAGLVWAGERAAGSPGDVAALLSPGEGTVVVAHRGDHEAGPENTLPAIAGAIDARADLVELDVQLTADGVPVILHDWTLDRTTDGAGPPWAMTAEGLARLEAGATGVTVPTLHEALAAIAPTRAAVLLELKGAWTAEQAGLVGDLVRTYGMAGRTVLASFDLFTLRAALAAAPELPRLLLARSLASVGPAVGDVAASAVGVSTRTALADPTAIAALADAGVGVFVYTLNSAQRWEEALALGVRGVITDDPAALRGWLVSVGDGPYSLDTSAR